MIPYLSTSELGLVASGLYCVLTSIAHLHPSIPRGVDRVFFAATVVLLLLSKNPVTSYLIDASVARGVAFAFAIVVGVFGLILAWWRGHLHDCQDHSPPVDDEDDDEQ